MKEFYKKCRSSFSKALDRSLFGNIVNLLLLAVAALLVISLMVQPVVLVAFALFFLFIWALLSC